MKETQRDYHFIYLKEIKNDSHSYTLYFYEAIKGEFYRSNLNPDYKAKRKHFILELNPSNELKRDLENKLEGEK